jgi:hypothetical protein
MVADFGAVAVRHYHWAGLDFLVDRDGAPVFLEANRASHMLGEYLQFYQNERPFELAAEVMNRAAGPPCLLWRRGDPFPDADEDATFIGRHLARHLKRAPLVCHVEENQAERNELVARDGTRIQPGSIFRWWYGLPWSYERSGVTVLNPNAVWVVVRDKFECLRHLSGAHTFRVPATFAVESQAEARQILSQHRSPFARGYVLKPRVGWGGYDVQIADPGEEPREIPGDYVLTERIHSRQRDGRFFEVRMFVMAGVCVGGIRHSSRSPHTNYWQGGEPSRLDDEECQRLAPAALEAVARLDQAADAVHALPVPPQSRLTEVNYDNRPPSKT